MNGPVHDCQLATATFGRGPRSKQPLPDRRRRAWPAAAGCAELLDGTSTASWVVLFLIAVALGAAHAIGPGHGKTLVTAVALGPGMRFYQPAILGLAATLAHTGSVLLIAAVLWYTGATRVGVRPRGPGQGRRLRDRRGRSMANRPCRSGVIPSTTRTSWPHGDINNRGSHRAGPRRRAWCRAGMRSRCCSWPRPLGRLAAGVVLVLAFSAGMAMVLVAVGLLAWKLKSAAFGAESQSRWRRPLALACGGILAVIGFYLFLPVRTEGVGFESTVGTQ